MKGKRGRPRKNEQPTVPEVKRKRGRPRKVLSEMTQEEQVREIAKYGKRKFKKAVEEMAISKFNKKMRRKRIFGNGDVHEDAESNRIVSVKSVGYRDEDIIAGPTREPKGVEEMRKAQAAAEQAKKENRKDPKLPKPELNRFIKDLTRRGRNPKNVKVLENKKEYFIIEFNDGENGPLTQCGHVKSWY